MSHWPEMTDGGNNDATVDRVMMRDEATRRLAAEVIALRARVEELTALVETTRADGAKLAEAGYFEGWWAAYNSPDPHKRKPSDDYADSDTRKTITILTTTTDRNACAICDNDERHPVHPTGHEFAATKG